MSEFNSIDELSPTESAFNWSDSITEKKFGAIEVVAIILFFISLILTMQFASASSDKEKSKDENALNGSVATYFGVLCAILVFLIVYRFNLLNSQGWFATSIYLFFALLFTLLAGISGSEAQQPSAKDNKDNTDESQKKITDGWKSATYTTLALAFGLPVIYYIIEHKY